MIKHEIKIHTGYTEWEEAKERGHNFTELFGKYQHIFWNKKGKISLVQLKNYFHKNDNFWEIFCLEGNLFEDVERFNTKKEAKERIREILKNDKLHKNKP